MAYCLSGRSSHPAINCSLVLLLSILALVLFVHIVISKSECAFFFPRTACTCEYLLERLLVVTPTAIATNSHVVLSLCPTCDNNYDFKACFHHYICWFGCSIWRVFYVRLHHRANAFPEEAQLQTQNITNLTHDISRMFKDEP